MWLSVRFHGSRTRGLVKRRQNLWCVAIGPVFPCSVYCHHEKLSTQTFLCMSQMRKKKALDIPQATQHHPHTAQKPCSPETRGTNFASNSLSEASPASGTCDSSSSSSRASTTWAEHAPDCLRCKGTHPCKAPARFFAVGMASLSGSYLYRVMAALTICDCFSVNKLAFLSELIGLSQEHVCLNQRIHLSSHGLEASQQKVDSRVVVPDFLSA